MTVASWPWDQDLPTLTLHRLRKLGAKAIGDAKRGLAHVLPEGHLARDDDGFAAYLAICGLLDQAQLPADVVFTTLAQALERAAVQAATIGETDEGRLVDEARVERGIETTAGLARAAHHARASAAAGAKH